jgi:hypothetical protein
MPLTTNGLRMRLAGSAAFPRECEPEAGAHCGHRRGGWLRCGHRLGGWLHCGHQLGGWLHCGHQLGGWL